MKQGASVTLIAGPVCLTSPDRVQRIDVDSAEQMYQATMNSLANCDIFIGAAAVADYRPAASLNQKIKKSAETLSIELIRNPDIIAAVANHGEQRPFTVGFAAETQNLISYAQSKLKEKTAFDHCQ